MFDALAEISRHRRQVARSLLGGRLDDAGLERRLRSIEEIALVAFPWERTAEDEEIAAAIAAGWGDAPAPPTAVLMASMALAPAHHFPKPESLRFVPPWLRRLYAKHLIARPPIFAQIGEAEQYVAHACATMRLLAAAIIDDHLPEAEDIADTVTAFDSTMTYFGEGSLKDYFADKARIVEWLMLTRGHRLGWSFPFEQDRPLRIGIVHRALEPGAEAAYLLAHLAGRERGVDTVTLYTWGEPRQPMIEAFAPWVSRIVSLPEDVLSAMAQIRRDQLDVCYFASNIVCGLDTTIMVAAHRVARVQIVGGASPASPGYLSSDIFISGVDCDPNPQAQDDYGERLAYLPGALRQFSFSYDRKPGGIRCTRAVFGIPPEHVIFFSAANYYKHTPEITAIWTEILARAPQSSLVLMPFNPNWGSSYPVSLFVRRLHEILARAGLPSDRVKVVERVATRADLHELISKADVYLDSFPYSGACSLVDPLMVGLPIVARSGTRIRTAQGGALLAAEGLEVCADTEAYVERAVRLAEDQAFRNAQAAIARGVAQSAPACLRTQDFARRFQRFCGEVYGAYAARYAALRAGTADASKTAVRVAVASAKQRGSPVLAHVYSIDVIARFLVPYLRDLARQRQVAGRVVDVGSGDGILTAPFLRAGFQTDLYEPDPAFAAAMAECVALFPRRARHDATPLTQSAPLLGKYAKKAAASAPAAALSERLSAGDTDIVRFDAARFDFALDAGLELVGDDVKIVMAEADAPHRSALTRGLQKMKARGFASVLFAYDDLSWLGLENWTHELREVVLDPSDVAIRGQDRAIVVFYREGDTVLLAYLAQLIEACAPANARPWSDGAAFVRRHEPMQPAPAVEAKQLKITSP